MYVDIYFTGLSSWMSTLLATKLADKVLKHKQPTQAPNIKPSKSTETEIDGLQYLSGYVTLGAETFASRNFRELKNSRNFCISRA